MTHTLFTSLAQVEQIDGTGLMMRLAMFYFAAILFFVLGFVSQQRRGGKKKWPKFVFGLLPIAASIWFAMDFFRFSLDGFSKASGVLNQSRETLFRASPFVSLAVGIALIVAGILLDRRAEERVSDTI